MGIPGSAAIHYLFANLFGLRVERLDHRIQTLPGFGLRLEIPEAADATD